MRTRSHQIEVGRQSVFEIRCSFRDFGSISKNSIIDKILGLSYEAFCPILLSKGLLFTIRKINSVASSKIVDENKCKSDGKPSLSMVDETYQIGSEFSSRRDEYS